LTTLAQEDVMMQAQMVRLDSTGWPVDQSVVRNTSAQMAIGIEQNMQRR
jgi:hypothetical protein